MRLRFEQRELILLRAAERLRGAALAHQPRPAQLRTALNLAKAGRKLGQAHGGTSISLEEGEVSLLLEALRYANDELHWAARTSDGQETSRRAGVLAAFPELVEHGVWRSFGLSRELEALSVRLDAALKG